MKKLFALILTVAMLLSFAAFAEEAESINWADVEATAAEIDADAKMCQIADYNLQMWIPSAFTETELSEENVANGYISILQTADEAGAILILKDEGVDADLEAWCQGFIESGYEDAEIEVINGIQAITYTDTENDTLNVMYKINDSTEVLQFTFAPASDEGMAAIAMFCAASIQPIE